MQEGLWTILGLAALVGLGLALKRCHALRQSLTEQAAQARQAQEQAQAEAQTTRAHHEAILASMAEGVMVVDRQHVIRHLNPAMRELFHLRGNPVGQTVLSALRQSIVETMIRQVLEEGTAHRQETSLQLVPGQESVHLVISTQPLMANGEITGAVTVVQNISKLRNLEEMRREFVANVSHELRTPLAIFHGYLENLMDRTTVPEEEELRSILGIMQKHSGRLNALVEDLLTLTRLESRRDPLVREQVDLREFFRAVVMDWTPRCAQKEVKLLMNVEPEVPLLALDPHRVRQVLDNLLDNALKYSPKNGEICLSAEVEGSEVHVRVTDGGSGIPAADLPHVFERFYRADRARSRELGGTGLGLSIVKHIVQAHGGRVAAQSTLGRGTTMSVLLPAREVASPA